MATRKHLLLLLLLAAVGCDAARFHTRFLNRVQNRQSTVPGNRDHSSGTGILSSTASSASSSYYGDPSSAIPVTDTTVVATDATQTMSSSSATTTSGNYSYGNSGSSTGSSNSGATGSGTGSNGMGNGMGNGSGGGMNNGNGTTSGTDNGNGSAGSNGGKNNGTAGAPQRPNILIFIVDDLVCFRCHFMKREYDSVSLHFPLFRSRYLLKRGPLLNFIKQGRTDASYTEGNIWTLTPHIDKVKIF